ncbi:protein brambleberry-like [Opisthocomus hoazin]|uniref:protein brambleberry-like n=1 Tax=Opisthocomus hoazin TaxID=30419 RepID=UPI003F53D21C
MLPWTWWALLLLYAAGRLFGCLGPPPQELRNPPEVGTSPWVPLEMTTGDERFRAEATCCKMSPQDSCHGQEELQERPKPGTPIHRSLRRPALDEPLIAGGQRRVAELVGNVSSRGATGPRVVPSDLLHTQEGAREIYSQLESDLALLLAQQRRMEEVMEKLQHISRSLELMLAAMEGARSQLEKHLQNLHAVLDSAGSSPGAISTLHGSYFILLSAFLVPTWPRAAILLLLFLASSTLGIPALSALLALAMAGQWLVEVARRGAQEARSAFPRHQLTSTPDREHEVELLQEELGRMEMSCLQELSSLEQPPAMAGDLHGLAGRESPIPNSWRTKLSSCGVMLEPALGGGKRLEIKPYGPSQSPASDVSLLSPRSPCQGLTRVGKRCWKKAISGQDFCHVHATGRASCGGLAMDSSLHI